MMVNLGGSIYMRRSGGGRNRYYFRLVRRFFENGTKRKRDQWIPLGKNLSAAQNRIRLLRENKLRGEEPQRDFTLSESVKWYLRQIVEEKHLLGWKTVRSNLKVFLNNVGDISIRRISREDVEKFLLQRKQSVSDVTVNSTLRDVKRLFNAAVAVDYLEKNPAEHIKPAHVTVKPCKLPTSLEVERLMQASPAWLSEIVLALVSTAARLSEVLRLDWSDIDFTSGTLKLRRTKVKDELELPMAQQLNKMLWNKAMRLGYPTKGSVFTSRIQKPYTKERVYKAFKVVAKRLGWPWLTLRMFRRFVATEVWIRTRDVRAVQKILGHANLRTSEIYMQGDKEARQTAVGAIDSFLNRDGVTTGVTKPTL